jgi:uncharacterized protein (TIGR00251 family)
MGIILDIKVRPLAGKQELRYDKHERIRCSIKSAPEKGRANEEVVTLIARLCKIPLSDVTIVAGQTSRNKRVKIETSLTREQIIDLLGLAKQLTLF